MLFKLESYSQCLAILCTSIFLQSLFVKCSPVLANMSYWWPLMLTWYLFSLAKLKHCYIILCFSFILYVWVIADRMGAKDLRRSGPNTGRRHMAYSNDKRNAYDNTKSKLRYEILCCLYFVFILCCGFLLGFALQNFIYEIYFIFIIHFITSFANLRACILKNNK